jgi:hypothetical protein
MMRVGEGVTQTIRGSGCYIEAEVDRLLAMPLEEVAARRDRFQHDLVLIAADVERIRTDYHAMVISEATAVAEKMGIPVVVDVRPQAVAPQAGVAVTAKPPPVLPLLPEADMQRVTKGVMQRVARPLLRAADAYERTRVKLDRLRLLQSQGQETGPGSGRGGRGSAIRRELRNSFLDAAELVLTTTSSAALNTIETFVQETGRGFDVVIVDEATQVRALLRY